MNFLLVPIVISLEPRKEVSNPIEVSKPLSFPHRSQHVYSILKGHQCPVIRNSISLFHHVYSILQGPQYPVIWNSISTFPIYMLSSKLVCSISQGLKYHRIRIRTSTSALSTSSPELVYLESQGHQYPVIWISIPNPTKSVAMMKVCSDCNPSDGITKPISLNQVQQILSYSFGPTIPTSITRRSQMSDYLQPLSTTSPSLPYISTSSQYLESITARQRPSTTSPSSPCISTSSQYLEPI